ncbi:MAG: pyruvate, phosphate dikinase [Thermoplasmatales archaeon]|nr:pyruvate, phosphate dikinase [Thermoplasmatales archaeon]
MKYVYLFEEGNKEMSRILGNKGAHLCELVKIGVPVPPGFIISTDACRRYFEEGKISEDIREEILNALKKLEERTGKKFGGDEPLLLSVRSGAPVSMPGMMDTIINLGMSEEIVEKISDKRFAYDAFRRFLAIFGKVAMGIDAKKFDELLDNKKKEEGVEEDSHLHLNALKEIVEEYKKIFDLPDPYEQLFIAISAVFNSWNNERAINYRKIKNIPHDLGTAVIVQVMVFGNLGNDSCTGVIFTRNPSDGKNKIYGEFLINAQGEDIVSGKRTPLPIEKLKEINPNLYEEICNVSKKIERHYRDMQDIEFTVERGKLYILQTRKGKRTAKADVKIAFDMVKEGLIGKEEALLRIDTSSLNQLLHKRIKEASQRIAKGLPASPGAAIGKICLSPDETYEKGLKEKIILIREETSPDDIHGVARAQGVITARGGLTSHAAVVSRGLGIPCIVGCNIKIDEGKKEIFANGRILKEGDFISMDGSTGDVYEGIAELSEADFPDELKEILSWADEIRKMKVYANADLPEDAKKAMEFGAEGIGLCRTEHMFLNPSRLEIVRKAIFGDRNALNKLLELQRGDFIEIFEIVGEKPIVIRLLDAPLHEFLPKYEELLEKKIKGKMSEEEEKVFEIVKKLREANPMLGFRGVRLGIKMPEIYAMQTRAIIEAVIEVKKKGNNSIPYIEIPVVSDANEIRNVKKNIVNEVEKIFKEKGMKVSYKIGTMIELPRACLTADEIGKEVDFISFGTNDLTQTTFGFSRDDAEEKFLKEYIEMGIIQEDPFVTLDFKGVGELMRIAVEKARSVNRKIEIGICGEHGGEEKSIKFCYSIGLDSISCSPYRLISARISAAKASIEKNIPDHLIL